MVHQFSLQDEFQVCLSCISEMEEMDEFKFRPKLLSSKLEIHGLDFHRRRSRRLFALLLGLKRQYDAYHSVQITCY